MNKKLPDRRHHKTPRPLWADAYTINGSVFESADATDHSKYYGTFRKFPTDHEPFYDSFDQRILFAGLQSLCDMLFYEPIKPWEVEEAGRFLKGRKVTPPNGGFEDFEFPWAMWERVIKEHDGWLPLRVTGMPEGSVVYPHEPFLRVEATAPGFGPLVPWFESTLLHVWATTERLTAARHFAEKMFNIIREYEPESVSDDECMFLARLTIHDFGDRGAASPMESELVGAAHNYVFFGTDTFRGAYQNWRNGAPPAYGSSVKALAHRIVQGYMNEGDCYQNIYDTANPNEFLSMVADCYDYWNALDSYLIPLAKQAKEVADGRTVVARPDSGDSVDMVVGTLEKADRAGLMDEYRTADGNTRKVSTSLRYIVGNGESYESVLKITQACLNAGYVPWRCGIYGMGGHMRNNISRDHLSTKFALCSVGKHGRPVIKFSNSPGKRTLPDCKVLRDQESLESGITLVTPEEPGEDALVTYYDGSKHEPFGSGFTDDFMTCENRVMNDFREMSPEAGRTSNALDVVVNELLERYVMDQ